MTRAFQRDSWPPAADRYRTEKASVHYCDWHLPALMRHLLTPESVWSIVSAKVEVEAIEWSGTISLPHICILTYAMLDENTSSL